jgi:hypothetical protein
MPTLAGSQAICRDVTDEALNDYPRPGKTRSRAKLTGPNQSHSLSLLRR